MGKKRDEEASVLALPVGPRLMAAIEVAYRARRPVLLEGPTGIGKSEIIQQVAEKLGVATLVLDLSLLEPPDLVGLPQIRDGRTAYAAPQALPTDGAGLLLLEELNRAERYIQQPALQLLTARRLHQYALPEGWSTCAAINPEREDYQVTPLDPALRTRFLNLVVRADRAAWVAWAERNRVHGAVLSLARAHDHFVEDTPPRTWTYVSDVLKVMSPDELRDRALMRDLLGGYLAAPWVEVLLSALDGWDDDLGIDPLDLLRQYHQSVDLQKTVRGFQADGRTDELEQVAQRVHTVLGGPQLNALVSQEEFSLQAFERLLADLPGDHRERLQEAFAGNLIAASVIGVTPREVLRGYQSGRVAGVVEQWVDDPSKTHLLCSLAAALCHHLDHLRRHAGDQVRQVRDSRGARIGLGQFLAQLARSPAARAYAERLEETLRQLSIQPIRPGGRRKGRRR